MRIETPPTPVSPLDVETLAAAAHAEGVPLAVDNTLATPLLQRPLELGAIDGRHERRCANAPANRPRAERPRGRGATCAAPPCPALPPALAARAFGGAHTSAERRLRWDEDAVSPGFIRLSAGIENAQDLVADVCAAPDATAGAA